jgi:DUF438 domain-containing protein
MLYIQKHIREFDYIDIASELARFVFKKPLDTAVHAISDKLASPLETLKRRGVPVDRLLQQYQSTTIANMERTKQVSNTTNERYVESNGRVTNFNNDSLKDDKRFLSTLTQCRAYTQTKFTQQEHVRDDIDHSCEAVPSANMTRYKNLFHSIPLYVEKNILINDCLLDRAQQLAWLLTNLAKHVFRISVDTLHLYRDIDGGKQQKIVIIMNAIGIFYI